MEDSENGNIWGGWHTAAVCQGWGLESQLEEGNGESWCVCVCVSRSRRGTGSVMGRKELELEAQTKRVLPALQALPTLHPRAQQFWLAAFLRWQRAQRRASVACLSLL